MLKKNATLLVSHGCKKTDNILGYKENLRWNVRKSDKKYCN